MAWTAVDGDGNLAYKWIEQPRGSALRLSLLRIHISEVSNYISTGSYTVQGKSHTKAELVNELERLRREESELSAMGTSGSSSSTPFIRGRARS